MRTPQRSVLPTFPPDELPNPFAKWLLDARNRLNLTQTVLGRHLGISQSKICGFENGNKLPKSEELQSLTDFLGPPSCAAGKWLEESRTLTSVLRQADIAKLSPFGLIIRSMRTQLGLSLPELSRMISPTVRSGQLAHDIEYGIRTITPELLQKLADIFTTGRILPTWLAALEDTVSTAESCESDIVDDDLPPLGKCLRDLRRARIGSRRAYAELTGLSLKDVQDIEFGRKSLSDEELIRIARALQIEAPPTE